MPAAKKFFEVVQHLINVLNVQWLLEQDTYNLFLGYKS